MTVSYPLQAFEKSRGSAPLRESLPERDRLVSIASPSPCMCDRGAALTTVQWRGPR